MYEKRGTKYTETMWAEHRVDIYAGPTHDQHKSAGWYGYADGDMDDGEIHQKSISHHVRHHPPGTIIVVKEPICKKCHQARSICQEDKEPKCVAFWRRWDEEQYE